MIGRIALACFFLTSLAMTAEAKPILETVPFDRIEGWAEDDHAAALAAFQRSCTEILATGHGFERDVRFGGKRADWTDVCKAAACSKITAAVF